MIQTSTSEPSSADALPPGYIAKDIPEHFPHRDGSESTETEYLQYLISGLALNNTIIIVPTNTAFARLAINFNCRMRTLGINNVLHWALDESVAEILRNYEIPVYYNPTFFSSKEEEIYHTENYIKMMAERPKFWKMVMKTGFNMLFLDVDNVILKNPLEELIGDADLEAQIDEFALTSAENMYNVPQMCGGAFFLKSNDRILKFLDRVEKALVDRVNGIVDDQDALNLVLRNHNYTRLINRFEKLSDGTEAPFGGYPNGPEDDRISARLIPVDNYMNGHIWRDAVDNKKDGTMTLIDASTKNFIRKIDPAIVHLNGLTSKENHMQRYNWWYVRNDLTCPLRAFQ